MASPTGLDGSQTERSNDFLVENHMIQLRNCIHNSSAVTPAMNSLLRSCPEKDPVKNLQQRPNKQNNCFKEGMTNIFSKEIQCDPCIYIIASQVKVPVKGAPTENGKLNDNKNNQSINNSSTQDHKQNKKKISTEISKSNGEIVEKPDRAKVPLHLQCDPCFGGIVVATNSNATMKTSSSSSNAEKTVKVLSLTQQRKNNPIKEKTMTVPFKLLEKPTTYLEVDSLLCQLVPKGVADILNHELSKTTVHDKNAIKSPSPAKESSNGEDGASDNNSKDWQSLPKNLMGKVAFFERLMNQKHETPIVDPNVKVKAEVSEKVKSVHDQVRTNLLASKATTNGTTVMLPDDITPVAKKKERVETFFPKDENSRPNNNVQSMKTSQWAKVETAPPSSFEPGPQKDEKPKEELPISPSSNVDDMVSAMEKNLDNALHDLDDEFNNFDNKLHDLDDSDDDLPISEEQTKAKPAIRNGNSSPMEKLSSIESEEPGLEYSKTNSEPPEESTDSTGLSSEIGVSGTEASPNVQSSENKVIGDQDISIDIKLKSGGFAASEGLKSETINVETNEQQDENIDPRVRSGDLAATEALKTETTNSQDTQPSPNAASITKVNSSIDEPVVASETRKPSMLADNSDVLNPAVSVEEVHGESLSRDVAAEVLEDTEEGDVDPAFSPVASSSSVVEFPSLAASPKKSQKRSPVSAQLKKSYARVLAEGKKLEQPKNDLYRFLVPPWVPAAAITDNTAATSEHGTTMAERKGHVVAQKNSESLAKSIDVGRAAPLQSNNTELEVSKIGEGDQRLIKKTPQNNFGQGAEESKSEGYVDPAFTEISTRRKKTTEDESEVSQPMQSIDHIENMPVAANLPSALSKANFNPYDALTDMTESDPTTGHSKKNKKAARTSSPSRKKPARFSGAKTNAGTKKAKKSRKVSSTSSHSPSLLLMPLHLFNNLVHKRPLSYIIDGLFWGILLVLGGPFAAIILILNTIYRLLSFLVRLFGIGIIKPKKIKEQKLAVVISGCDTGFGRDLAFSLMKEGFVVFCGCLCKDSMKNFEKEEFALPLLLDVTKDNDVDKAVKIVMDWLSSGDEERYLHALVNNAGIGMPPGLIDWLPMKAFENMMSVNYYGMIRTTKKFLPLFKFQASQANYTDARVVNMVSVAGIVSGSLFGVAYESSKHAAECFTANLRSEGRGWGLKVAVISPSFHRTPLTKDMSAHLKNTFKSLPPETRNEYGEDYAEKVCGAANAGQKLINWDSCNVVDAMKKSLVYKNPPARIVVGSDAKYVLIIFRMLPTWFTTQIMKIIKHKPALTST